MRILHIALLLAGLLAWTGAAVAKVQLRFVDPLTYSDGTLRDSNSRKSREQTYNALYEIFESLARRHLGDDQVLAISLTDLDLAGEFEPWRVSFRDVRIMRRVTWPRMTFTYEVRERGEVITSGTAKLADMDYLNARSRYFGRERLRYERRMLSDWFYKTFSKSNTARVEFK